MAFESFPFEIGWEMTLACNLCCKHCASSAGLPRPSELTTKEAFDLCDQFPDLLVKEVDFTGGEALLRTDWMDIAIYLKDLEISTNILTNGLSLKSDTVSNIKEAGISAVGISLDGLEQTHDYIRGHKGAFKHVIRSIKMLKQANINLIVITTVNALNIDELPMILQLLQSEGVHSWRVQPMIPIGRVRDFGDLGLEAKWIMDLVRFVRDYRPIAKAKGMRIICGDGLELVDENWIDMPWRGCPAGLVTCGITSDGKVIGCLSMPDELVEGNLRKKSLWDIWFDPDSFAYTRRFSKSQLGPNCDSCDKSLECLGGCSTCSYAATGHFHDNPYCFYRTNEMIEPLI